MKTTGSNHRLPGKLARYAAIVAIALAGTLPALPAKAQGDLLVAPTRVILDGRRGTEVILSNIGSEEATYRVELELRRMTPEGGLIDVEPDQANAIELAALEMIRYAPRRITLPPGQPQAVRLSARPGAELPDGEYRVHMAFRAIPRPVKVTDEEASEPGLKLKLVPVYGVTIPIIVRHGQLEAKAALEQPRIERAGERSEIRVTVNRAGQASTYGDLQILRQGSGELLYAARGLAVYAEVPSREFNLPVANDEAARLNGPVRIEYREAAAAGGGLIAAIDTVL
ncbi:molecular chaperone [Altererythrobacter sp. H2]|uniref:molecular chaperone n=1 Tax=Altererythrobacter sp. H2 TaxID=3108391 RepID=UPI002B4C10DF|nr:molecular chaperone [Altererythrobacter sp. H2]WRK96042.1 molecular chaperone [Altererythrobacter sp. H2]